LKSADTGKTFSIFQLPDMREIKTFDVTMQGNQKIIVACTGIANDVKLYVSTDEGITWNDRTGILTWVPYSIKISHTNLGYIYIGNAYGFYRSTDYGYTWEEHNEGLQLPHAIVPQSTPIVKSLEISRKTPEILFAGSVNDGLFTSTNKGETWQLLSLPSSSITSFSSSLKNHNIFSSGTGGIFVYDGYKWNTTSMLIGQINGSMGLVRVHPYVPHLIISSFINSIFDCLIYISNDTGNTWQMNNYIEGGYITKIVFDHLDSNLMYSSYVGPAHGIQVSTNQGINWSVLTDYLFPVDLIINPKNNQMLYALEGDGIIFRSTNRGVSWSQIRASTDSQYTLIRFDPFESAIMYLGGYTLFKSDDSGFTWRDLSFNKKVSDLTFDNETGEMFIATSFNGVWRSTNGGDSFTEMPGLPSQEVSAIHFYKRWGRKYLMSGSGSLGAYEYDLGQSNEAPTEITTSWNVAQGWNLLSVPVTSEFILKDSLFPTSSSPAFTYNNGYTIEDSLQQEKGFWLKYDTAQSISLTGEPTFIDTIEVQKGWNLIGSISYPVSVSTISGIPSDLIQSDFYGFDGSYFSSSDIEPGRSYWVKVKSDGYLILYQSTKRLFK
jgi:photosystem II stability/assembly factor-like uncharacterized protein